MQPAPHTQVLPMALRQACVPGALSPRPALLQQARPCRLAVRPQVAVFVPTPPNARLAEMTAPREQLAVTAPLQALPAAGVVQVARACLRLTPLEERARVTPTSRHAWTHASHPPRWTQLEEDPAQARPGPPTAPGLQLFRRASRRRRRPSPPHHSRVGGATRLPSACPCWLGRHAHAPKVTARVATAALAQQTVVCAAGFVLLINPTASHRAIMTCPGTTRLHCLCHQLLLPTAAPALP